MLFQSDGQQNERRKFDNKVDAESYKEQAYKDALQWEIIVDDQTNSIVFMSKVTGELRAGQYGAQEWVVQDDGFGCPCFYNMSTSEIVHEDPRFIHDSDMNLVAVRNYVMCELRLAVYFCRDFWERYEKAIATKTEKEKRLVLLQVLDSQKPKHLNSFLIRARALFQSSSVVDVAMNENEKLEMNYANWLVLKMHDLADEAQVMLTEKKDIKAQVIQKLTGKVVPLVTCRFCSRQAKKNLGVCHCCVYVFFSVLKLLCSF